GLRIEVAATPRQAATDLMDIADQFIDLEASVAQFARADLPPRQAYGRPEGAVPNARPAQGGYAARPYGASVRGYQGAAAFSPHVAATLPPGRVRALLAVWRAGDTMALGGESARAARPGWNLALRLCLERQDDARGVLPADRATLATQAERFLAECDQLALA